MTETIKTLDLEDNEILSTRDVSVDRVPVSVDINQVTGEYLLTYPRDIEGLMDGDVIMYPQSPSNAITSPVTIKEFYQASSLYYPLDAKFDYVRGKIWIIDNVGDGRVIKIKKNSPKDVDVVVDDLLFPYAVVPNLNTGGCFVRAFEDDTRLYGIIHILKSNGDEVDRLTFENMYPPEPSPYSIVFDHVRSRLWWVAGYKVYMADVKNMEVRSFDIRPYSVIYSYTVDVEFKTGNAFVIVGNNHDERFVFQIFRDNNLLLGSAYLE